MTMNGFFVAAQRQLQVILMGVVVLLAVGLVAVTVAAAFGVLPWLTLSASFGETTVTNAGMIAQIGVTALFVLLALYLPANARILQLENSHRKFNVSMEDVRRAYHACHSADRESLFGVQSEFDSVRARIQHLRAHPDLGALEPEVMELAAQMSHESHDLAATYSDEAVARAKGFLKERQEEIETFKANIAMAKATVEELKTRLRDLDSEDAVAQRQLDALELDLLDILPQIGIQLADEEKDPIVIPMSARVNGGKSPMAARPSA